ncbi:MAG TPA: CoA-transferase [Candidatus Acidoferrales bacterium]|nr:CoA-transferase [Candidatus Acidoferrales bacterium]
MPENSTESYTSIEMMATAAARQIRDHEVVFVGTGLPMLASMLALKTHAPHAVIMYESGYLGCRNRDTARIIGDIRLMYDLTQVTTMVDVLGLLQSGKVDVGFLGGAQIDKYGNINATVIGDYLHPKVRLPGSGGAIDIATHAKRLLIIANHERRRFPERVDYVTSPGWLDGPNGRTNAGLRWGGPDKVITDLSVLGFNRETKQMQIESLHPGSSIDKVQSETGFQLLVPIEIATTAPPSKEELRILREEVDPTGFFLIRRMKA